jgi:hypothetical protein
MIFYKTKVLSAKSGLFYPLIIPKRNLKGKKWTIKKR